MNETTRFPKGHTAMTAKRTWTQPYAAILDAERGREVMRDEQAALYRRAIRIGVTLSCGHSIESLYLIPPNGSACEACMAQMAKEDETAKSAARYPECWK